MPQGIGSQPPTGGRTAPIGGRTMVLPTQGSARGAPGSPHLNVPKELEFGAIQVGQTARGTLRFANDGAALLTGTARTGPDMPWLRVLNSGSVYCAAGGVGTVEVEVDGTQLRPGKHVGAIMLDTNGGRATVQVTVSTQRESLLPAILAAVGTAVVVLVLAGLVYASNNGKLPFTAAAATRTPTPTLTPILPTPTVPAPTVTDTPVDTPTVVNVGATATAEAQQVAQAQQLVANDHATATAVAESLAATATAVTSNTVNQAPGATEERQAIYSAVNRYLLVRIKALGTGDGSALSSVATGKELDYLRKQLDNAARGQGHTKIVSIDAPEWDAISLNGPNSADATLTKHEDELFVRTATGQADDVDPSFHGVTHTLRNQVFSVTYKMALVGGQWLVTDHTVHSARGTVQPDLLPPPGSVPVTAQGTATAVPTVAATGDLTVEEVTKRALPSVLRITGDLANNQQSTGTGFVIQTAGNYAYVVTNDHVVTGATNITLSNQTNNALPALSVQEDNADDLAVIKIAQPASPLPALSWGDSDTAQLGENVVAIGYALGLQGEPTVSSGILSALHRDVGQRWRYLQHTAPINHGNSGGPLLDLQGTVIGINTLLDENAQSVYFAIPASKAQKKIADLIAAMP